MKKGIALLCLLLLLAQNVVGVCAATPTIVVSEVSGAPGETVSVSVRFVDNPGIISAKVKVGYDAAALEFLGFDNGDFPDAWYSSGDPAQNPFVMTFCHGTAMNDYTAQLFTTLHFKVREDAAVGTYPVTLTCDFEGDFFNRNWDTVTFAVNEGSVTVTKTGGSIPVSSAVSTTTGTSAVSTTTGTSAVSTTTVSSNISTAPVSSTATGAVASESSVAAPSATVSSAKPTATTVTQAADKQEAAPASPSAVWIPLAAVAVLTAALTLFAFLGKKKK